jgi:hypothetical protein
VTGRRHTIHKVFSGHGDARQLVVLGSAAMTFTDGRTKSASFAAHLILTSQESAAGAAVRLSYMEAYLVCWAFPLVPLATLR